ncbi:MAG: DUF1698 domain-containing protein [Calditrichaeota bacterium]|nr:MAG: DUF1698 domain-containing protein [Calditrichota bacterium]
MLKSIVKSSVRSVYDTLTKIPNRLTITAGKMGMVEPYQPVYGEEVSSSQRLCQDRWNIMKQYLPKSDFSFMDIGSQIGYFTFQAAAEGAVSFGVERSKRACQVANAIKELRNMEHAAFLNMGVDSFTVKGLPKVDVLCCMSIYHHWVRESGFAEADKIFTELTAKTNALFFDTGQSNEENTDWTESLEFMNPDPIAWIENYLKEKQFTKVIQLGLFGTHLSHIPRMLFYAEK